MTTAILDSKRALERELRGFVAEGSELARQDVIPQNDRGPIPTGVFATVLLLREVQEGYPAHRDSGNLAIGQRLALSMRSQYSVEWYGDDFTAAERFFHWAHSQDGIVSATRRRFALQGMSTLRRLDFLPTSPVRGDTAYHPRTSLDLDISYWIESQQVHEIVGHVDINTLDYEEGQPPVITQRVEVDGSE